MSRRVHDWQCALGNKCRRVYKLECALGAKPRRVYSRKCALGAKPRRVYKPNRTLGAICDRVYSPKCALGSKCRRVYSPKCALGSKCRRVYSRLTGGACVTSVWETTDRCVGRSAGGSVGRHAPRPPFQRTVSALRYSAAFCTPMPTRSGPVCTSRSAEMSCVWTLAMLGMASRRRSSSGLNRALVEELQQMAMRELS